MDLSFIKGMSGETTIFSDNTMNYVVLRTLEGDITFTYEGDDRINTSFSSYEKLGLITQAQHQELLNTMNTCEWDKKVDFVNGEFKKVERYSAEVKSQMIEERAKQEQLSFYNSEKAIALRIEEDYRLELEPITDTDMSEVKTYMKSIKPNDSIAMNLMIVERPEIMKRYEVM